MTKQKFLKFCKKLYKRGYRRNFKMKDLYKPNYSGLFYYYYKVIDETRDKYGDRLVLNQLLCKPWSFPERSIEELEQIAKDFGEWCKQGRLKINMTKEDEIDIAFYDWYYKRTDKNNRPRDCFIAGFKCADKSMIDKACEWLDENLEKYIFEGREGKPYISVALIDEFKEAMLKT